MNGCAHWSRLARFHNEVMPSLDCGCFVSAEAEAAAYDLEMQKLQLAEADLDQFIQAKWSLAADATQQAIVLTHLNEFGDIAWRVERR